MMIRYADQDQIKRKLLDSTQYQPYNRKIPPLSGPAALTPLKIPGRFRALLKGGQFAGRKLTGRRVWDGLVRNQMSIVAYLISKTNPFFLKQFYFYHEGHEAH